jgi:phage terminase large subunit
MGELEKPSNDHSAYLVCPNCGGIELLYTPQDYQEKIHEVPYREILNEETGEWELAAQIIASFGGYGSGKSKASLQEYFLRCLENPKGTGLVTAPTLQLLKRTTIKTLLNEIIPPPLVESYNKTDGEIHLANGFTIFTIPSDDDEKLRSINAGLIH